jgi:hypothetical protein
MKNKSMTIHQFMEMYRIKEFNQGRLKKSKLYLLLTLLLLTGTSLAITIYNTDAATTAFKLTSISM